MKIKLGKIFNWEMNSVFKPEPIYFKYTDEGEQLIGYSVKIVYKYHGERNAFFSIDIGKFNLIGPAGAYKRACSYCDKQLLKIRKR